MLGDAAEAGEGVVAAFDARVEVAEGVEGAVVLRVHLDDAPVLLHGRRNLALCKILLGRADGFCLVESHVKEVFRAVVGVDCNRTSARQSGSDRVLCPAEKSCSWPPTLSWRTGNFVH